MNRRRFVTGLVATLATPAIIRTPGLLMPIKPVSYDFNVLTQMIEVYHNNDIWVGKNMEQIILDLENMLKASWNQYIPVPTSMNIVKANSYK
jgi:hypothetical protein